MDTTNLLLIILIIVMIFLVIGMSQKHAQNPQNNVVYLPGPRLNFWGGQGPLWRGPRPGRRFRRGIRRGIRRRFWW
jgi:hypothetical protein